VNIRSDLWSVAVILFSLHFERVGISVVIDESGSFNGCGELSLTYADVDTFDVNGTDNRSTAEIIHGSLEPPQRLTDGATFVEGRSSIPAVVSCLVRTADPDSGNGIDFDAQPRYLIDDNA
jgi:hypothetical protein